jgi:hypothetical protein
MKTNLNKEQLEKLIEVSNKQYIDLVKFLYDHYKPVLREYEKIKGKLRIEFLK